MKEYDIVWHSLSYTCENASIINLNYLFLCPDNFPQILTGFTFSKVLCTQVFSYLLDSSRCLAQYRKLTSSFSPTQLPQALSGGPTTYAAQVQTSVIKYSFLLSHFLTWISLCQSLCPVNSASSSHINSSFYPWYCLSRSDPNHFSLKPLRCLPAGLPGSALAGQI